MAIRNTRVTPKKYASILFFRKTASYANDISTSFNKVYKTLFLYVMTTFHYMFSSAPNKCIYIFFKSMFCQCSN